MAKKTKHSKHNNVSRKRNKHRIRKQTKGSRQPTMRFGHSWDMSSSRIQPPEPESKPVPVEVIGNDKPRHTRSKNLDE